MTWSPGSSTATLPASLLLAATTTAAATVVVTACGHGHCEGCDAHTERQPIRTSTSRSSSSLDCHRVRRQTRREMLGLQKGQSERAEHLRALPQDPRHDPCVLRGRRNRVPAHGLSHRVEQEVARLAQVSAHHDRVGLKHIADRGHRAAEHAPGVGDRALAAGVAALGQPHDVLDAQHLAAAAAQQVGERGPEM